RDMLIAPVFTKGATSRSVYLPKGDWYDWWTNEKETGGQRISRSVDLATMPIYVRAGAIIPFDPIRQYTDEKVTDPTTIKIYGGADGNFVLYEDDGSSQEYLDGEFSLTDMTWNNAERTLTIAPGENENSKGRIKARKSKVAQIPEGNVKEVHYSGQPVKIVWYTRYLSFFVWHDFEPLLRDHAVAMYP